MEVSAASSSASISINHLGEDKDREASHGGAQDGVDDDLIFQDEFGDGGSISINQHQPASISIN